jgi:hypothetical protein
MSARDRPVARAEPRPVALGSLVPVPPAPVPTVPLMAMPTSSSHLHSRTHASAPPIGVERRHIGGGGRAANRRAAQQT